MSTWLYLQAFVDLALGVGFVLLLAGRRRDRAADRWQREVAALVDTLGELMVEVERITATSAPASTLAPTSMPAEPEPPAEAVTMTFAPVPPQMAPEPAPEPPAMIPEPPENPAPEAAAPATPMVDAVLAFAREGLPAEDIARRVGRPVGEVALTLGLRGPRTAAAEG
jgi:hypothetical protein